MSDEDGRTQPRVLITGASGSVGRLLVRALAERSEDLGALVATDVREAPAASRLDGVEYLTLDVCDPALGAILAERQIDTVVHLAAVVTPQPGDTRERQYKVDVEGTDNVLRACVEAGVGRLVYTSSGAAYGYHADSPALLVETDSLRGNDAFAYASHKRIVEEHLAEHRGAHPELSQVIFRVSTVLGPQVRNQITALFERPVVVGIAGVDSPFCFIWDEDVAGALIAGIFAPQGGIYNLTGDGVMTLREIAHAMGRRYVPIREAWLTLGLAALHKAGVAAVGPEQLLFLRHRPVLSNQRLKDELGFFPQKSSRQVFDLYRRARG